RIVSIRPQADLERALETPVRERVQQDADAASYVRRAQADERERTFDENELQSKIELATREQQLVQQEGANDRRRSTERAPTARLAASAGVALAVLTALALQELAKHLPEIGTLNLTPDVLTQALSRLAEPTPPAPPAPAAPPADTRES